MHEIDWPDEYKHVIPPDAKMVLEMYDRPDASWALSRGDFFYLGCTKEKGISIWLKLRHVSARETRLALELSLEEVETIRRRLQTLRIDLASDAGACDGGTGLLRVQACEGFEVTLKWESLPSESWEQIIEIVDEIRQQMEVSSHSREIPLEASSSSI